MDFYPGLALDYETLSHYNLTIIAVDGAAEGYQLTGTALVQIEASSDKSKKDTQIVVNESKILSKKNYHV